MFKNGYKIILIKEGKYDLRQFNISAMHVIFTIISIFIFSVCLLFIFSNQLALWSDTSEINNHQKNNQLLLKSLEENQKQVDLLLKELDDIKMQDNALRKLVKLPPIHDDIRKMGYGGIDNSKKTNDFNYLLPPNDIDLDALNNNIDYIHRLVKLEILSYNELRNTINENKEQILSYPAIYPIKDGELHLSSNYGYRSDPFSRKYKFHDGHDFAVPTGTDVYSSANGRVIKSQYLGSFGNYVEIDHGNGYITVYGHLSSRKVRRGEKVLRGQKIGEVGNTGRSTAPHLHYEIRYQKQAMDPSQFYFDTYIN